MNINQFDYHLPAELIAQTPLEPRHASRLMMVHVPTGQISHHNFLDLVDLLHPGDMLVANDSRVIPARLFGRKISGGQVEILLLKRVDERRWEAMVGGKRLRPGVVVEIVREQGSIGVRGQGSEGAGEKGNFFTPTPPPPFSPTLKLTVVEDLGDSRRLIEFNQSVDDLLAKVGHTPLPPYIHTPLVDGERYQTIYSRVAGSSAAPTAGLHFTSEVLLALREKGVGLDYVTLHIGLDTLKPVTAEHIEMHQIHREYVCLTADTAQRINQAKLLGGRLVAVGTTAMRTLETAALRSAGVTGSLRQASAAELQVECSKLNVEPAPVSCPWRPITAIEEETDLFIYPGFTFRAVDALLTNFHLPRSTLLMLVSAFGGLDLMRHAYQVAVAERYRFYSFGDAMLIWR
jgi:S-adenosylmethionine:tRNA ribosyltransferase-isomerase